MTAMLYQWLLSTFLFLSLVNAQVTTTLLNNAGYTIVVVITTNTLAQTVGTTTIATLTSTPVQQTTTNPGPVGVPAAAGGGGGDTPYTYTTTNAQGLTTAVAAIFTPSFSTAPYTSPTSSGTVMDYSAWLSLIGTNTVAATSAAGERWHFDNRLWGVAAALSAGVLGGAWVTLV